MKKKYPFLRLQTGGRLQNYRNQLQQITVIFCSIIPAHTHTHNLGLLEFESLQHTGKAAGAENLFVSETDFSLSNRFGVVSWFNQAWREQLSGIYFSPERGSL